MLKVAKPNEFDLVFKLQIPYYESIVVSRDSNVPGNVLLDMTRVLEFLRDDPREDCQSIRKLLQNQLVDAQNFLVVDKLRSWLQSLFSQALNRIADRVEVDGIVSQLKYRTCGPAHTIVVDGELEYSVDFVPAIRLGAEQNVLGEDQLTYFRRANLSYWEAIPKPLKIQTKTSSISFRSSFYAAEKAMLPENCRDAIKLMKKFRDVKTNLSNLKSYYIKTLFLWKIRKEPESYWQKPLTVILPDMFEELTKCLGQGKLPFFWDPELNMIDVLTPEQVMDMYLCVRRIPGALRRAARQRCFSRLFVLRTFSSKEERDLHLGCSLKRSRQPNHFVIKRMK
ncbi:LOW QUALITY PROTEIN: cyclic GMP-AMP synthase-like receptor 2 [Drosophila gunungcola]|uniref:LOW QUALITY PROTEIN: cyclic GMP-AMP synthase-like receptor 2 n=1 Tax=Drosophila gunungcola TaxID=103775 RepID=UPI0022E472CF|nr:LOW QUALITY PROTEIN: cyclic GMP-AMP synthase-like receptor 2 [Drosophila gunungcola]